MELIFTFSFLEILRFLLVVEIYIEMSEISNFCINFTNDSISDVHTCVTHPVSLVLSSQNALCMLLHIRPTGIETLVNMSIANQNSVRYSVNMWYFTNKKV